MTVKHTFTCPHCGAEVKVGSQVCPECGSDKETGWAENAESESLDIPTGYGKDDDFDYDEFTKQEFEEKDKTILGIPAVVFILLLLGVLLVMWLISRQ